MATSSRRASVAGLSLVSVLVALAASAQAVETRAADAEQLFVAGKKALAAGDLPVACARLAESVQLEAATGSLLALAVCHERQHKLVQAVAEYEQVLSRSLSESRTDRAKAALSKLEELKARISTLTIHTTLAEESPTLAVRMNGQPITTEQLGTKLPVEGSAVLVEASAPGKQAWRTSVTISGEGQSLYLTIPALSDPPGSEKVEPKPRVAATGPVRRAGAAPGRRLSTASFVGIGLLAGSALTLGIAGGYTAKAASLNTDSEDGCAGNVCDEQGRSLRLDARRAGNVATASLAVGASLGVAGLITYLTARRRRLSADRQSAPNRLQATGWVSPTAAGAGLSGSF